MANANERMPVLFVGHGSPMNAIENNEYTKGWEMIAREIPRPKAILSISAHWYTNGSKITDAANSKMIYDMYGFPDELYQMVYKAKGAPELAHQTRTLIDKEVQIVSFCQLNYGVAFKTFSKIEVNGKNADPLYVYLKNQIPDDIQDPKAGAIKKACRDLTHNIGGNSIKWNFTKFLIDKEGNVVARFAPAFKPEDIEPYIEKLLNS